MDNRPEVRDFLMSRRSRISPEQAGLPASGTRRVPGLRRSEAAALAGVSVEYYTRLERGDLQGVSEGVLDAIARALQLDEVETGHLHDLARAASSSSRIRRPARAPAAAVPAIVQRILDGMPGLPAFVQNTRFDVLATNALGRALYAEVLGDPASRANTARFVFLSPAAQRLYVDWERVARGAVGQLRVQAGRDPSDTRLSALIGELSVRSDAFRVLWGANDVHVFQEGVKAFRHAEVGDLRLEHAVLAVPGAAGLSLTVYSAAPGSPAEDGLALLASLAATRATADAGTGAEDGRPPA